MAYADTEGSVHGGDVRELYTFTLASGVHRLTSHDDDVTYDGQTYTATPGLSRGNVTMSELTQVREMVISLPVDHPVVLGMIPVPPRTATVAIVRVHAGAGTSSTDRQQIWRGQLSQIQTEGGSDGNVYARIRVPGTFDVALDVQLPILRVQRSCQHQLYSVGCGTARGGGLQKNTTVSAVNGATITCASLSGWTTQATHGEVVRVSDGERRSILLQTGNDITIDVPFATIEVGDSIEVHRGCDKQPDTCRGQFANIRNFGGHPHAPIENPASPTGRGVR